MLVSIQFARKIGKQFPNLPALDRQVIAACCSKHILPFDIVEDPVFSWAYPCAVSGRQSISDRVSELAREWRLKITEKIRGKFLTIMLDGWTKTVSNNLQICYVLWSGEKICYWKSVNMNEKKSETIGNDLQSVVTELHSSGAKSGHFPCPQGLDEHHKEGIYDRSSS